MRWFDNLEIGFGLGIYLYACFAARFVFVGRFAPFFCFFLFICSGGLGKELIHEVNSLNIVPKPGSPLASNLK
jgi:hypothetical protein